MPALSKKQQKFMGIVRSIQKGEQPASKFNKDAQDVAKDMKKKDVKDFASTKHKGLPMKKEILGKLKEMVKQELSEYTYGVGDVVKDVNPTCPHFGAEGKVKSVNPRSVVFIVKNKGDNFKPGQELEKSHDQMKKIGESVNETFVSSGKVSDVFVKLKSKGFGNKKFGDISKELSKHYKTPGLADVMASMFKEIWMKGNKKEAEKEVLDWLKTIAKKTKLESAIQEQTVTPINKIKDIKNLVKKDLVSYRGTGAGGNFEISIRNKKVSGYPPSFALLQKDEKKYQDIRSKQFKIKPVAKYFIKGSDLNQLKKFGHVGFLATNRRESVNESKKEKDQIIKYLQVLGFDERTAKNGVAKSYDYISKAYRNTATQYKGDLIANILNKKESVNEMSAKSKKIINKLGKKEKEMFIDMVDMLGFDQVMADYKRDKNAFKQALKDMSESVIQERNDEVQTGKEYTKLWLQSINLVIKQANGLKGALAKHPIKRDINKLKAVEKLFKKFIKPAIEREGKDNRHYAPNQTQLKKYLSDSKFKIVTRILRQTIESSNGYDENSFYYLGDKEKQLTKKMGRVLYDIENKMDNANLENVNESMNPSAVKKMRDEFEKTGQLPPHLKKFALDLKILKKKHKVKNIVVPGLEWMSDMNEQWVPGNFDKALGKLKFNQFTPTNVKRISKRFKVDYKDAVEWIKLNHVINVADKPTMAESINEDGHTDVASAKRKAMLMVEYSNKLLNKLNGMNKEDSLPSWLSDKITLASDYLHKATHYLLNPVESVNEGKGVEKVLKMANDQSFGKLGGRTVDALSAGLFKGVYDKASDKNKEKINKMNEKQLYVFMTKLWSKFGNQVRIG